MLQFMQLVWKPDMCEVLTFILASLGHAMTFTAILTPVFPVQILLPFPEPWGSGLWPPVFSVRTALEIPFVLKTFGVTYALMTHEFVFPRHISPLNARLVFVSSPGCLISTFV